MTHSHHPHPHPHRRSAGRPRPPAAGRGGPQLEPGAHPAEAVRGERLTLSVTEAAAVLGISRALAYELVARGELPALRLGRRVVVPRAALLDLLHLTGSSEG